MAHAINLDPKPPHRGNALVFRSISAVCMKALEKDPKNRYRTASGLADDIRAYNEGRPVGVVKPGLLERAVFWTRRDPVRAALTWAASLVILTGFAVIGLQVIADRRLAQKTMNNIAVIDQDVAGLRGEVVALRRELAAGGPEREERRKELKILEGRVLLREIQAINAIRSVRQLRFIRSNSELDGEARRRLFALLDSGADSQHALLLHALATAILEEIREGTNPINHKTEDIARLEAIRDRTGAASGLQPQPSAPKLRVP